MYTSDDQGTLELRDTGGTPFTLEEFFRIWGYRTDAPPIAGTSPYYIWVDGVPTDARNVQIHGGDHIAVVLAYPYYI
jgi:hypothetical protein